MEAPRLHVHKIGFEIGRKLRRIDRVVAQQCCLSHTMQSRPSRAIVPACRSDVAWANTRRQQKRQP